MFPEKTLDPDYKNYMENQFMWLLFTLATTLIWSLAELFYKKGVFAMSGNGAIAAPIISSVCVFSLLLSRIFLKEKLSKKQYAFIAIVILGILTLAVAEEL